MAVGCVTDCGKGPVVLDTELLGGGCSRTVGAWAFEVGAPGISGVGGFDCSVLSGASDFAGSFDGFSDGSFDGSFDASLSISIATGSCAEPSAGTGVDDFARAEALRRRGAGISTTGIGFPSESRATGLGGVGLTGFF